MVSTIDRRELLTCNLCLDIYTRPKLLPCGHTFCITPCLQRLASYHGRCFPCPICRKYTFLPPEGVSGFPNNIHILERDLQIARDWEVCLTHDKVIEFYCTQCTEYICINCKVTVHERHDTEDLSVAVTRAREDLAKDRSRLRSAGQTMSMRLEVGKNKQKELDRHQEELEKQINSRHKEAIKVANQERDNALKSLHDNIQLQRNKIADLKKMENDIKEIGQLLERVNKSLSNNKSCELLAVAKEMKFGRGGAERVKTLTASKVNSFEPLIHHSNSSKDDVRKSLSDFLGTIKELPNIKMKINHKFRCGGCPDRVLYLCHTYSIDSKLEIFFETGAPARVFTEDGQLEESQGPIISKTEDICTYTKKPSPNFYIIKGAFFPDIFNTSDHKMEFSINIIRLRAVDADKTKQVFIVVDEPGHSDVGRKVLMFRKPTYRSVSTYAPPAEPFQPSDVCFYKLGGEEVLLIADEAGNTIHVVNVNDSGFTFLRYLTPPSLALRQPTAINVDLQGRLWVACINGKIITIEPKYQLTRNYVWSR